MVYLVKDASLKDRSIVEQLTSVGQSFSSKISRGINFYFMWLDVSTETEFSKIFGVD